MVDISIIIPIYNKDRYLEGVWEDLLNQTFTNYECLLIDDGSTDNSANLCDKIVKKDSRFKVFHICNGGVSHARNVGLNNAKGEFITFIDADDRFDNQYLQNLYECMINNHVDMVIGSSLKIWEYNDRKELIEVPYKGIKNIEQVMEHFVKHQMENGIYGYCWGKLLKRSIINTHRFNENIRLAEDLDFYLSLYTEIKTIYFDNKPYYFYLQEAQNSSMLCSDYEIDYFSQLLIQFKVYKMLKENGYLNKENEELIINRIYDYIFFTLYHSPKEKIKKTAKRIRSMNLPQKQSKNKSLWQYKWIMLLFQNELDVCLYVTIKIYRFLKKIDY